MVFLSILKRQCTKVNSKVLSRRAKEESKNLNGYFAIYKEKNMSQMDVLLLISLTLNNELGWPLENSSLKRFHLGPVLCSNSTGVMALHFGQGSAYKLLFKHLDKRYQATFKLGMETETCCAIGKVISEKPFDHITKENIDEMLKKYIRTPQKQKCTPYYLQPKGIMFDEIEKIQDQPLITPKIFKCAEIFSVKCKSYNPPLISLELHTSFCFDVERFSSDLGKELGSCAHAFDVERTHCGFFEKSDALPQYKWYKKYIEEEMRKNKERAFLTYKELRNISSEHLDKQLD